MLATTNAGAHFGLAGGLLIGGAVTIVGATAMILVVYLRRLATRQWQNVDPLDESYGAVFKRTMFKAERVKWLGYAIVAVYALGVGLLIASGIARVAGK